MKLTGARILMECLREQKVDTIFGYPGGTILNVYDALYDCKEITHILTSHEQGAAHAADGYARSTGKVGVCFATSGPGATNLTTGIATAYMDSSSVVFISCNVPQNLIGRDAFQEVDITGITMPITKSTYLVRDVTKLLLELGTGFAFLGNQYHLNVGGDDFYIDLLFYNLNLRCYVVIELKTGEFKPEYAGQLNFYLSAVDDASFSAFVKCGAVIILDIDELVHVQYQGRIGMLNDDTVLMKQNKLAELTKRLLKDGFDVYITADHGNTPCTGLGRLTGSGVEVETRSHKMVVLKDFANKDSLIERYGLLEYPKYYLPKDYDYLICNVGDSLDIKGENVMTHGGISLDEVVVPFIIARTEDYHG